MDHYSRTIRKMLIIRVFLLPFLVLLLVYGTIIYSFASYASRQVQSELMRIATDHRNLIDQFLNEKAGMLKFMANTLSRSDLRDHATLEKIFKRLQAESKAFFDLGLFDENGDHVAYAGPFDLVGKSYAQAEWFKTIKDQEVFISDEFLGYRNIPHFVIAVRRQERGQSWYLRATIDTYYFNDLVENIRIGHTGEAYIVNSDGVLQTRRRSGGQIMEADPSYSTYRIGESAETVYFESGPLFSRYLYASAPIRPTGWMLVVRQAAGDAYAHVAIAVVVSLLFLTGGGAVVVIMGFFMASKVAARLQLADLERREMKTQLILAGKMAEVGEMSTGIAHEINNPLQVMKSEVAMIQSIIKELDPAIQEKDHPQMALLKDSTEEIGLQIDRCSKITNGLLNFARKNEGPAEAIMLQEFIPKMTQLVDQRARLENIRIVQEIETDLPGISCQPNQLQQVFLNLFNNAIYALKGRKSPEIRVRSFIKDGAVNITVADNGCGFSTEAMEKAFIPFYTTKPAGQGTGLGLSTVYGIIKAMGGDISLTSENGAGSEFTISLPMDRKTRSETNFT
jgi:two-component system NtrC family sensor kinase